MPAINQLLLPPLFCCPRAVDKCFVPTEFCRQLGKRMGLSDEQLVLYGLPIRPVFDKKLPAKHTLRKKLVSSRHAAPHMLVACMMCLLGML